MSTPSTPDQTRPPHLTIPFQPARRVQTLPTRFQDGARSPIQSTHAADTIETLITIDFAKVVAFEVAPKSSTTPNSRSSSRAEHIGTLPDDEVGAIPWTNSTERTLAAGKHF